jgi:uncharacterized membrane protein (DUF373 family)
MRDDSERSEPALDEKGLQPVPYTAVHRVVRRLIEPSQDVLVVVLALVLFGAMLRVIVQLGFELVAARFSFRSIIAEALFVLVLIELQRLLILYLRDHHVSVDVMVEATIVGVLREVLLFGAIDIDAMRLVALTLFVLALGALLRFGDIRASRRRIHAHGRAARTAFPSAAPLPQAEEQAPFPVNESLSR